MKNVHGKGEDWTLKSCESTAARDEVDDSWDKQSEIELAEELSESDKESQEKCETGSTDLPLVGRVVRKPTHPQLPGIRRTEGEFKPSNNRKSIRIAVCRNMVGSRKQQKVSVSK
ncbi:hypothetical protein DPMN_167826 [Dreissena polymorpha]|uniref:Uncharacterized protein n=1 Tax=Dreissena polymorpha TaxID=45954 RepID=A0A9D4F3Z1_DREPO|nr:hypothetical protein DPMN_167826 [Dreissena polymorpha]